jgi:hypothetical protein
LSLQQTEVQQVKPRNETDGARNAARLKSNKQSQRDEASPFNSYGTHQLCAWKVGPGQFWFQTTRSDFARKLAKRRDTRRVEIHGLNHYRQTFEIWGSRRKIERIVRRYLGSTPDQFSAYSVAQDCSKTIARVETAGRRERTAP